MNRLLHTTAVLLAAIFIFAVCTPTAATAVPPHTYVTCTAEAEGQSSPNVTAGENVPTEDVTTDDSTDDSTVTDPTADDSTTHDTSSLASVIVAIVIAVALVVVIVALIPRKRQS